MPSCKKNYPFFRSLPVKMEFFVWNHFFVLKRKINLNPVYQNQSDNKNDNNPAKKNNIHRLNKIFSKTVFYKVVQNKNTKKNDYKEKNQIDNKSNDHKLN